MSIRPGDPAILEKCAAILAAAGIEADQDLAAEMMQAVVRLAADAPGRGDMKLMLRTLKELRYGFRTFKPYRSRRKVSVFGSARTRPEDPDYVAAQQFAHLCANAGFMVITGAGGGIMQAGNEGAGQAHSFGVAIRLPFEQQTNPVLAGDQKLVHFRYFFSRKLMLVKETHAIALFPGGFGTHDEGFEVLTLVQTGRCDPLPIVMVERPGGDYWQEWDRFVHSQLVEKRLVSPEDPSLYFITTHPQAAVDHIARFYRNYHSLRYIQHDLALRLQFTPTPGELAALEEEFSDILEQKSLTVRTASQLEPDWPMPEMPYLLLHFNRRSLARLRQFINRLNELPSLPPLNLTAAEAAEVGSDVPDRGVATIAEEESITLVGPTQ